MHTGTLALALSSITRREADAGGYAMLIIVAEGFLIGWLTVSVSDSASLLWDPLWAWLLWYTVVAVGFSAMGVCFLWWRLNRMRFGNIAFESASVQK